MKIEKIKGKIFNEKEVKSILSGSKVQFREVIKKTQIEPSSSLDRCGMELLLSECPYQVGQEIFVKEEIAHGGYFGACFVYCADGTKSNKMWQTHWSRHCRPANYMNEKQSRITLEITDIKVERLASISEEDAIAEGIYWEDNLGFTCGNEEGNTESPIGEFADLWNATHKKPEEKFKANPFVWVVDFKINK